MKLLTQHAMLETWLPFPVADSEFSFLETWWNLPTKQEEAF